MRKLVFKLLMFIPVVIIIVIINYVYDPANLYKADYERNIAGILMRGKNVTNIENMDERLLQKYIIKRMKTKKDIIVLGSSRTMLIRSNISKKHSFYNHSMSGATIEDYMAVLEMYLQKNSKPSVIIMGIDPWVLNKNSGQYRWRSLKKEYRTLLEKIEEKGLKDKYFSKSKKVIESLFEKISLYKQSGLFSISYFQSSLGMMFKLFKSKNEDKRIPIKETTTIMNDKRTILWDGSFSYPRDYNHRTTDEVRELAIEYANRKPIYSLGKFNRIDLNKLEMFKNFFENIQEHGIKIILYFTPYHPEVFKIFKTKREYKNVLAVQDVFVDICKKYQIIYLGSYDPAECGLEGKDFLDGMHLRRHAIRKIISQYYDVNKL